MRPTTFGLGARQIGAGQGCFILAGVASAHGGSAETALRMLDAAFKMGADGIAFQIFRAELLAVRRHPDRKGLDSIELTARDWRRVLEAARGSGLAVVAEAFDAPSLELAAEAAVDAFQVHATDMENPAFIRAVGELGRPVFLATGGVPAEAVADAMDLAGGAPLGLLHGLETFPTAAEEIRFRDIASWKERCRVPVGFLDHTDGGSAFALVAPALAAAYGADLVEKHFVLDRREKGFAFQSSLSPEDFYRMVELLRQAERASGDFLSAASEGAVRYHRAVARSIVAAGLIARGEVLTASMLAFKRADSGRGSAGFPPRESHRVIGRRAVRPIQADEIIREDMLE
jgi:sialic acid synthase SpsE